MASDLMEEITAGLLLLLWLFIGVRGFATTEVKGVSSEVGARWWIDFTRKENGIHLVETQGFTIKDGSQEKRMIKKCVLVMVEVIRENEENEEGQSWRLLSGVVQVFCICIERMMAMF
ncbi:hypothetical protein FXO37_10950 [Capsicum annuum]|nr:hypothetical protein FXO37_10950 [Capsicum annuum]